MPPKLPAGNFEEIREEDSEFYMEIQRMQTSQNDLGGKKAGGLTLLDFKTSQLRAIKMV